MTTPWTAPARRRIYLMRHGSVDYFTPEGKPVPPDTVSLNAHGQEEANAAGRLFAQSGVQFDRVVVSGLTRTVQTAQAVLRHTLQQAITIHTVEALQEIKPGHLPSYLAELPPERSAQAFTQAFDHDDIDKPFLGGETVRSLLARVLPAFEALCKDDSWQTLLLVLHGGVNRAIIGSALNGRAGFAGQLEQNPACINILDVQNQGDSTYTGDTYHSITHIICRSLNITPIEYLHSSDQRTTMEKLWMEFETLNNSPQRTLNA